MDVLNLFSSTKKKEINERELKDTQDRIERENELYKIERERIKVIEPLDIDKMEEFKNRTLLFLSQCKKKEYIYDYFQRMSSNVFSKKNNRRPSITELIQIIIKSIPKDAEREIQSLYFLDYDDARNKDILAKTCSEDIIDTLYDFCKSVDTAFAEMNIK